MTKVVGSTSNVSLDSVEQALSHWRENKSDYPSSGIPDELWLQIFALESETRTARQIRSIFSLNSQQYQRKYLELVGADNSTSAATNANQETQPKTTQAAPSLVEVCVENNNVPPLSPTQQQITKSTIKSIKSTHTKPEEILDNSTVVLECIRNDGHRLRIHTSSQGIEAIMSAFYSQEVVA